MPFVLPDPHTTLRLHLNENTSGCSPAVLDAIRAVDALEAATYPNAAPARRRPSDLRRGAWMGPADRRAGRRLRVAAEVARVGLRPH
jgi:hypothetical protein